MIKTKEKMSERRYDKGQLSVNLKRIHDANNSLLTISNRYRKQNVPKRIFKDRIKFH